MIRSGTQRNSPMNRVRLLNEQVMGRFLEKLMAAPEVKALLSNEHFSVEGTLLQAWASHASLERIDGEDDLPPPPSGPGEGLGEAKTGWKRAKGDFRGIKLSNKAHRSCTDPDALLARKSNVHPALPSYRGHVLMESRHNLVGDCRVTQADGYGERDPAKYMAADLWVLARRPSVQTRTPTPEDSWLRCGGSVSLLMWPRTQAGPGAPPMMAAPPAMRATPSRSMHVGASKRFLAGLSSSAGCASSSCAVRAMSVPCSAYM